MLGNGALRWLIAVVLALGVLACEDALPPPATQKTNDSTGDGDGERNGDGDGDLGDGDGDGDLGDGDGDGDPGDGDGDGDSGCAPGEQGPDCEPCEPGEFCPGGSAPAVGCSNATWDDDQDPATACVARRICVAGEQVADPGDTTHDRDCTACPSSSYSLATNTVTCTPWTDCEPGEYIAREGTALRDQRCTECPEDLVSGMNATHCVERGSCELSSDAGHHDAGCETFDE